MKEEKERSVLIASHPEGGEISFRYYGKRLPRKLKKRIKRGIF